MASTSGELHSGLDTDFVATVLLASRLKGPEWGLVQEKDPALNQMRMAEMVQLLDQIIPRTAGDGVILFPGGWFHSGEAPAGTLYAWVGDAVAEALAGTARRIVVAIGIDGSFDRPIDEDPYDGDQIALAIDRTGIIAIGRKFYPGDDEAAHIRVAEGHLAEESGKKRTFELNGVSYFLFMCNDIKAPYHDVEKYPNPGVQVGLNLIHRINEKGQPLSQENNFACIFGARTSFEWNVPVFLVPIFFRNSVPADWPSGVFCPRPTLYRIGYDEIRLSYTSLDPIPLEEGYADVRVFRDIPGSIQRLKDASRATFAQEATLSEASRDPKIKTRSSLPAPRKLTAGHPPNFVPADKFRPQFEAVLREFASGFPLPYRMSYTSGRSQCRVVSPNLPAGLIYEFDDWPAKEQISIEIDLDTSKAPRFEPVIRELASHRLQRMPAPSLRNQGKWLRVQIFYSEDSPPELIAGAMAELIAQTDSLFAV